jgi:hypothetical protein
MRPPKSKQSRSRLKKRQEGFEDEGLNGEPQKNRNACAIVCEISDQEPLGSFFPNRPEFLRVFVLLTHSLGLHPI